MAQGGHRGLGAARARGGSCVRPVDLARALRRRRGGPRRVRLAALASPGPGTAQPNRCGRRRRDARDLPSGAGRTRPDAPVQTQGEAALPCPDLNRRIGRFGLRPLPVVHLSGQARILEMMVLVVGLPQHTHGPPRRDVRDGVVVEDRRGPATPSAGRSASLDGSPAGRLPTCRSGRSWRGLCDVFCRT